MVEILTSFGSEQFTVAGAAIDLQIKAFKTVIFKRKRQCLPLLFYQILYQRRGVGVE